MLDGDEFKRWLRSSRKTLDSAIRDLRDRDYNWACFKAHQAAEKALKALLWGVGSPEVGHSLPKLLSRLNELEIGHNEQIWEACMRLNKYYIPTRYPDVWSEGAPEDYYTEKEAMEAIEYTKNVINWVEEIWKKLLRKEKE